MHIVVVGVTHRTAPIAIRERLAIPADRLAEAVAQLHLQKGVLEAVIIATCNRTEFIFVVDQSSWCPKPIIDFMERWFGCDREELAPHAMVLEDLDAVRHVMRMTAGLDSLVCGETQILGQVKTAFAVAQRSNTTGTLLNQLFREAITIAKKAHKEVGINDRPFSLASVAVSFVERHIGGLQHKRVVLLGAGEMSALTSKHLVARGCTQMTIVNRSLERAHVVADAVGGHVLPYEQRYDACAQADVVITQTGSEEPVLHFEPLSAVLAGNPLLILDMAVPRDVDVRVRSLSGVQLYDLDDISKTLALHERLREQDAQQIEAYVAQGVEVYHRWVQSLGIGPLIGAVQAKATDIHHTMMEEMRHKLPHLSEQEWRIIHKLSKSMLNQLLHRPIHALKESTNQETSAIMRDVFATLFGVLPEDTIDRTWDRERHSHDANAIKTLQDVLPKIIAHV